MHGMRVVPKLKCVACRHYAIDGSNLRCIFDDNTYKHWMGVAYRQHPSDKNYRGVCKDYEEKISN